MIIFPAIWFFMEKGGKVIGEAAEERWRPSPIPKGGLEEWLKATVSIGNEKNDSEATESFSFHVGCYMEQEITNWLEWIDLNCELIATEGNSRI